MKLIERKYLQELKNVMGTPDIKIITGVRRSGKSILFNQLQEFIRDNYSDVNIININFNLLEFDNLRNYKSLNEYVESKYIKNRQNFLFIDEVQMCGGFEKVINSLHASGKYDIYITGSNSFLLSSDLATLFTGRTYTIKIFPFSFDEFCTYYGYTDVQDALDKYILVGGMPGSYLYHSTQEKYNYIGDIHDTLLIRDIVERYKLQGEPYLENLDNYLMDNIGNITNSNKIANELTSKGIKTNHKTIESYLYYLCNSFLYYKIKRYDIQGKRYLATQDKYYLVDQGFKYAKLGTKNINYGRVLENIIAIELLRRGYELYIGTLQDKEIDFVAIKQHEKIYIQVSSDISDENTFKREVNSLLKIKDAYPKYLLARTRQPLAQYEGIQIIDIAERLKLNDFYFKYNF